MIDYCQRERTRAVPVSAIQKAGPGKLRGKAALEAAMRDLAPLTHHCTLGDHLRRDPV